MKNQHKANKQLEERRAKYDDLVNKHMMMEKEFVTLKKASENRKGADKKSITSLKKEKNHYKLKWKAEKENIRLIDLIIEEERSLRARYQVQANNEKEARKAVESDIKEYINRANTLRDQVSIIQSQLESWEEEVNKIQEQFKEWQDHISNFDV